MYVIIYDYSQSNDYIQSLDMNVDSPSDHTLSRVARKKQETRARILAVSEELMRVRPIDQVTIKDITDAADVGHGSFYLHFNGTVKFS